MKSQNIFLLFAIIYYEILALLEEFVCSELYRVSKISYFVLFLSPPYPCRSYDIIVKLIIILINYYIRDKMASNSNQEKSRSLERKKRKQRQYKKDSYKRRSYSSSRSPSRKKKKHKEKQKYKRNKSRSRERSRDKKQKRKNSRNKSKSPRDKSQAPVLKNPVEPNKIVPEIRERAIEHPKRSMTEEERHRKFAMRQVRARLLKLNGLFGKQEDSDEDNKSIIKEDKPNVQPPPAPNSQPVISTKKLFAKKQSKWGKTSSNDQRVIPMGATEVKEENNLSKQAQKNLSIDIEHSEDKLGLSEDKSIDVQEPHLQNKHLDKIEEEEIDPLDQYMNQIQGDAVVQIQLPKKGQKGNVISFEDIVTQNLTAPETIQEEKDEQKFKDQFMKAIMNIEEVKNEQNLKKGDLMQHNQEQSDISDFQEEPEQQLDFFAKQRKMAERKELHQIDHSKIQYEDVTFNLYREAEQVKMMDPKMVVKYRKEAGDIKIRGKGLQHPILNWFHCGFSQAVLSVIQKNKFQKPFPIQAQSIPMILSGRDVIGIAETGSGKTLAYLLPMLKHVSIQKPVGQGQGPIGIIMTPTRQLANQVYIEAKKFCKSTRIRILAVYGGLQVQKQLSDFRKGAQIVICTPGRMIDILTLNKGKITNLKRVTMIVIDEADRMFDLGFEPQITRIIDNVRPHRQTVMFSATFPKNVENLARRILTNPVQILVGSRGQACRNVEQIIQVREEPTKFLRLLQILGLWNQKGSILIFIDKQNQADYLYQELAKYGYHSLVLHGAMDPTDRQFTIYDFKKGIKTIMIATSVCARGLDIKEIILVVNFKCPNHLQDYIHRIGRTGRAGNKGTAITFITPKQEQYSIDLLKALQMSDIQPTEDLIKLSQQFLKKVKKGEVRKIRNRNIQGAGFKFDKEEEQKTTQVKDMLKKQLKNQGLGNFDDSSDEDISMKKKKEEELRGRNQQERVVEAIKNPQIKNKLLNQAVKAVSQAIKNGSQITTQKLLQIAVGSMKQSVTKHKVITSVDDGVEQVTKLINQFTKKGTDGLDFFSYDFQINDYPPGARQRACNQNFLNQVQRDNNCSISLRGTFVEPGKKPSVGNRKLYLNIQSQDKSYVSNAYKDIKRVIEESAYENMHVSAMGKYAI